MAVFSLVYCFRKELFNTEYDNNMEKNRFRKENMSGSNFTDVYVIGCSDTKWDNLLNGKHSLFLFLNSSYMRREGGYINSVYGCIV